MPFRFFRRQKLFPGVTLNFSKSGPSLSFGPRGFKHTIGPRGRRTTVGLPGTGLHYTTQHGKKAGPRGSADGSSAPPPSSRGEGAEANGVEKATADLINEADAARAEAEADRLLLRAIIAFQSGRDDTAADALRAVSSLADGRWLMGLVHVRADRWQDARAAFQQSLASSDALGGRFEANGVLVSIKMAITPEITAIIEPTEHATRLILAEACQAVGDLRAAAQTVVDALDEDSDDPVLAISLAEIALAAVELGTPVLQISDLIPYLERGADDSIIAASLALYRARVAVQLGDHSGAIGWYEVAETGVRDSNTLSKTATYERALCFREIGDRARFRQVLSGLHARDPDFADVRALLSC